MKIPSGKSAILMMSIIVLLSIFLAAIFGILFFSDRSPDPLLAQSVQDEYSVPVNLNIVNVSGKNVAYIIPEGVRWGSGHKRLLYNFSNPKETSLAFVEAIANNDAEALGFVLSQTTKDYWERLGYKPVQVLDSYRSMFKNIKDPYLFDLEKGEDDPSEGMLAVILIRDSGDVQFDLNLEPDGTWKI